ncbi:unnamed protein product [Rotaria magnacalcarata]|uniref:Uncharacterized protein n=1 Tax=Rotaria magnacalcarata TaxID=392030 RepID=A0A816ZKT4_9BILA|nr:unnamed protein product [Rotaria magnacalcarata]CAF1453625.1 unnamed protein product [Rotaria magnacalcarata]CAF2147143.1 unnamed protein product [Rotaria magnacalcarata]CAF2182039.1 unnamed protein product [Rotaria magnacalcarata]CAF2212558.1 unnamed protein product [Rotaria magnacalcarata]
MFHRQSLLLTIFSIILIQISYIYSTPVISATASHIIEKNYDDYQRAYNNFISHIKNIVDERNIYEQTMLLNQLREYLNRMCIAGLFGATHAEACQHLMDVFHQNYIHSRINNDDITDTSNEEHGLQKRFFCNGFIGCKNAHG